MYPIPINEDERLDAVRDLAIVGTAREDHFDAVCRTACALLDVPIALISLIEAERQWFKATCGIELDGTTRDVAFCAHAILSEGPLVVPDAAADPCFRDNPLVTGAPGIRFYAGIPLILEHGIAVGTLCVIDTRPRAITPSALRQLQDLAAIVVSQLRLHQARVVSVSSEAALRVSEARHRSLSDALPQMVWIMRGADGRAVYANAPFRAYYGDIGMAMEARTSRHHPDDAERIGKAWEDSARHGRTFEVEGRLRRQDGAYRWHRLVMIPVRRGETVVEWFGTALDIDAIVTANRALQDTTELLRFAQEAAGAGLWEWDLASGTVRLSARSVELQGFAPSPDANGLLVSASEWTANLHPDDAAALWSEAPGALREPAFASEYRVRTRSGEGDEYRWIQSFGRTLSDAQGRPSRVVGLDLDVTARKRAEAALEAAKGEAERASAAKTDFLAAMSHEIRTPLNGILGYADLLLSDGAMTPAQTVQVERIRGAGQALRTVVNDILDFSKVEAGHVELDHGPFALSALVEDTVAMVRGEAQAKGLALSVALRGPVPGRVVGDADRLRQVLLNLLNNAVKFTPEGSVVLEVACAEEDGRCRVAFAVRDTGIGIPEERHGLLFQRFSQLDASISRRYGGTGLGLAISQHLVALMGARITVESGSGNGSTFRFAITLPLAAAADAAEPAAVAPAPRRTGRILVVDDVAMNRDIARAMLAAAGHAVETAEGGVEAVRAMQAGDYDLVLMDIQMPGMDGVSASRHIRAVGGSAAGVPIIALTANVLPHQVAGFAEAGMNAHLGKPFKRDDLLAIVDHWLPVGATDEPALDPDVFAELQAMVGVERALTLLERFAAELSADFPDETGFDRARLAGRAHATTSSAGLLGFAGLSALCREVEAACLSGADPSDLVDRLRNARDEALKTIATLRAA